MLLYVALIIVILPFPCQLVIDVMNHSPRYLPTAFNTENVIENLRKRNETNVYI